MNIKIYGIDIAINLLVDKMRYRIYEKIQSDLMSNISETCCKEISETVRNFSSQINSNIT